MPIVVAQELSGSHALPEAYYVYSHSQNHLAESQENCSGIGAGSSARSPAKTAGAINRALGKNVEGIQKFFKKSF